MRKKIRNGRSNYAVGYGRPPTSAQFQPGQSGNPKGRPKGARNASSLAREALERPINVKVKGTSRKMTVRKAAYFPALLKGQSPETSRRLISFYPWRAKSARPSLISLTPRDRPRRTSKSFKTFLITGAPACCKASRETIQSAGPARLKREPNDQPKSVYRLCEQPSATSAASRWSNNQSRSR